jgi:toxin ParE1/3/4
VKRRYTRPALADLDAILEYIAAHSPQAARRIQAHLQAVIDLLLVHPRIGRRTDDPLIRRMTAARYPYLIFYQISADEIIIHAIWHSARDPRTMPGSS